MITDWAYKHPLDEKSNFFNDKSNFFNDRLVGSVDLMGVIQRERVDHALAVIRYSGLQMSQT